MIRVFFSLVALLAFAGSGFAQADRLDRIDAKLGAIEAKLDKLLAGMQPAQQKSSSDPYLMTNWNDFIHVLDYHGQCGLVVGNVKDPWYQSYVSHYEAPSGWKGLADGCYLPFIDYEGKVGYHPYQPQQVSSGPATVRLADGTTFTGPQAPNLFGTCSNGGTCQIFSTQPGYNASGGCGAASAGGCGTMTSDSSGGCGSSGGLFSRMRERRAARRGG